MRTLQNTLQATLKLFLVIFLLACNANTGSDEKSAEEIAPPAKDAVVVTTTVMQFDAPSEIPSGWITFKYSNKSTMTHFAILERLPDGKTVDDQQKDIAPIFQNIMDNINGKALSEPELGFETPEWFNEIVFLGGPGFTAPGHVSESTVYLEPGTYILECYVKTNGVFHSYNPDPEINGMVHQLNVTGEPSGGAKPEATVHINLSSGKGIEAPDNIAPGKHTIAVHFLDQKLYPHYLGHDLHVMKVSDTTDLDVVAAWMDWSQPTGMETPCPAEFIGGTHEMPAGSTGYFHVDLKPGKYAFIAEVPKADSLGMLKTFEVTRRN